MPHPLVLQLRFTRSEFRRAVWKVPEADARKRVLPMNSLSWTVGHLAWQEQRYFITFPTGTTLLPEIQEHFAFGAPHSTPPAKEMWAAWRKITRAADRFLDTLTTRTLQRYVVRNGKKTAWMYGNLLQRVIYHYWYHIGEDMAVRKLLGHTGFGYFVGDIDRKAPYTPERTR
ncbi:MAG TPA: DinB family protein [Gemmatimonadales bacterium]|nr:DinB family protein [Gemmatimonadales bacterium]